VKEVRKMKVYLTNAFSLNMGIRTSKSGPETPAPEE
jgi:hypothetical protein